MGYTIIFVFTWFYTHRLILVWEKELKLVNFFKEPPSIPAKHINKIRILVVFSQYFFTKVWKLHWYYRGCVFFTYNISVVKLNTIWILFSIWCRKTQDKCNCVHRNFDLLISSLAKKSPNQLFFWVYKIMFFTIFSLIHGIFSPSLWFGSVWLYFTFFQYQLVVQKGKFISKLGH